MNLIWIISLVLLILFSLITILNTLTFPRLRPVNRQHQSEDRLLKVSLLIPARNEAAVIQETIRAACAQDYPEVEIILLDDGSSDGTADLARQAAGDSAHFQVVQGQPLPAGWTGKNWACQQLADLAQGDLLVFTDADVQWAPGALSALVDLFSRTGADTLTVWPTQSTQSWGERLVVPMMMFVIMAYLPEILVRYVPWPVFSAANGQCLAFRRAAYESIGGHQVVRGNIVEDVGLAWETKRRELRMVMSLGEAQISGRMYHDWASVKDGFAKNILAGHGGVPFFLMLSAVFHWLLFLLPFLWLPLGFILPETDAWPAVPLAMAALGLGMRALSAAATRQRLEDALLLPVSVLLMSRVAIQALLWHYQKGGPLWKGRQIQARGS